MALGSTAAPSITRDALRNLMMTSMFGRRAGMDSNGFEVGEYDTRLIVDNINTTAASSLQASGFSNLSCTSGSSATYSLLAPVQGVYKTITQFSSSTLGFVVQFGANAQIVTTAGTSFNQAVFAGVGHTVCLACVSTSTSNGPIWVNTSPASPGITFSTY